MKTRLFILVFMVVAAVSARTMSSRMMSGTLSEMMSGMMSEMMSAPYDTLNREVYSKIPRKPRVSRQAVPVMNMPKSGEFNNDDDWDDDDEYISHSEMPKRSLQNMTDREWLADMLLRVDSVARKSRSYQKAYTVTTGRGRKKRSVTKYKTVEQNFTMGCSVFDLTADSLIYSYDPDRLMKPASTQKLFTAITFLANRGSNFEFNTTVTTNGKIVDTDSMRYLKGDIYVKGCFDPTLDKGTIRQIARGIERLQLDSIDGRIIADGHQKGSLSIGASTSRTAALNFVTSLAKELKKDSISFPTREPWGVSVDALNGKTEITTITNSLGLVMQRMLKRSNNEYAEAMLQNICKDDGAWSYDRCREAVIKLVKGLKVPKRRGVRGVPAKDYSQYYTIIDGSGLSHSNRTSAETEVMLLRYAYKNEKIFRTLYDNLPIAGVDGTIGKRMKGDPTYNNVHAKTGTIDGVSTLSGYLTAANGHLLAFAILVNETSKTTGHNVQDDICLELAR